jgi:hypothetical protein
MKALKVGIVLLLMLVMVENITTAMAATSNTVSEENQLSDFRGKRAMGEIQ